MLPLEEAGWDPGLPSHPPPPWPFQPLPSPHGWEPAFLSPSRPLIKLHIIWKKDGVPLSSGISDYNRRLTIPSPTGSDAGYYECEVVLRSSSVPAVVRGAYLSVLGEMGQGYWGPHPPTVGLGGAFLEVTRAVAVSKGAWF